MLEIRKTTCRSVPDVPFQKMARAILGSRYQLSLVLCGDSLARKINRKYRKKTYAANVLSFPLSGNEGEIFLNMKAAHREAKKYGVSFKARLSALFIHACLHLKGLRHGRKMDAREQTLMRAFG